MASTDFDPALEVAAVSGLTVRTTEKMLFEELRCVGKAKADKH